MYVIKYFNYLFFRTTEFFKKKRDSTPEMSGVLVLSVFQCFAIIDLFIVVRIFYKYPIPDSFSKYWILPIYFSLVALNWAIFGKPKRYIDLKTKWKDDDHLIRRKKGFYLLIVFFAIFVVPLIYGLITQNIIQGKSFF